MPTYICVYTYFLDMRPKSWYTHTPKNNKLQFIKMKNFCSLKNIIKKN